MWTYRPSSHKTQHHGRGRTIYIGPKGQEVLRQYLLRQNEVFCFSPKDSEKKRLAKRHADRKTPLSCGNRPGNNRVRRPKRSAGDRYDSAAYRRAVTRAVNKINRERKRKAKKEGIPADRVEVLPNWGPKPITSHCWNCGPKKRLALKPRKSLSGTQRRTSPRSTRSETPSSPVPWPARSV